MLKFVILAVACFILYKLVTNDKKKKVDVKNKQEEKLAQEGVLVKDPVCGTYVSKESDIRIKEGEEVKCFCSYECRDKYLKMVD
ncbi:MAG: transcriptional regulator [Desulfomicrobium sp.]|jgi:YHS domain-containing protein|nr:transcriptional regulator [Pseudomonadota bacterium]MBV1713382.1 transcriptional regulator [Desulfomicrobium sp.]MBU4570484.1 transcriptional regulator [Pseudomonadota bacterium]MBU4593841.1 transcriptional regulator [Pseudomonadota bacterium]MBV1719705.1 transcriptional regulator [Desulfomicrobium sp.]